MRLPCGNLYLRSTPAKKSGNIITALPYGTAFVVKQKSGSWYKVRVLKTGKVGWLWASYTTKYATAKIGTNKDPLNVRTGPGMNRTVLGSVKKGAKVTVKSVSGDWAYITYGSLKGWAYLSYLKF